jgi:uncharacterized protein YndB with AHSA1/START domain
MLGAGRNLRDALESWYADGHEIYIKATARAVWDAITTPEWTAKYGYRGLAEYDLRPGGAYRGRSTPQMVSMGMPEVAIDGEVVESDPPRKLVQRIASCSTRPQVGGVHAAHVGVEPTSRVSRGSP